jgi:hypothetical protein
VVNRITAQLVAVTDFYYVDEGADSCLLFRVRTPETGDDLLDILVCSLGSLTCSSSRSALVCFPPG